MGGGGSGDDERKEVSWIISCCCCSLRRREEAVLLAAGKMSAFECLVMSWQPAHNQPDCPISVYVSAIIIVMDNNS